MKARVLKKLLNNTLYYIGEYHEYIGVGSPMCHELISLNKETLKIKYALDTFHEGRKCLIGKDNQELLFIWDKLQELIDSGQIHDIINGHDDIPAKDRIVVFTYKEGNIIETHTDALGWPNTTYDGKVMYNNDHFTERNDAIKDGIEGEESWIEGYKDRIVEAEEKLRSLKETLKKHEQYLKQIQNL